MVETQLIVDPRITDLSALEVVSNPDGMELYATNAGDSDPIAIGLNGFGGLGAKAWWWC